MCLREFSDRGNVMTFGGSSSRVTLSPRSLFFFAFDAGETGFALEFLSRLSVNVMENKRSDGVFRFEWIRGTGERAGLERKLSF